MFFPLMMAALLAATPATAGDLKPGTITIEQRDDGADPAFTEAVQAAILRANFIPLPAPSHSRYVAVLTVTRTDHGLVTSGTKGSGPVAGIANWGAGLGMRLPKKGNRLRGLVVTDLKITMLLRSDNHPVWSGIATTAQVDGTRAGSPEAVATKLADALMAQFPRTLEGPLSVP
jgi:hypothetical protein